MNAEYYKNLSLDKLLKGKKTDSFLHVMQLAITVLESEPGELVSSSHDYEIARYNEKQFSVVFYPHQTKGTGNRHIRIRGQSKGGKLPNRCKYIMAKLNEAAGYCSTFTWKGQTIQEEENWLKLSQD